MKAQAGNDIYAYHFDALYKRIKGLIGCATINPSSDEDETFSSGLLFDIGGPDFNRFKTYESEYRYWVEVSILKIVENLLQRRGIWFEEHYHGDGNEQHSNITRR